LSNKGFAMLRYVDRLLFSDYTGNCPNSGDSDSSCNSSCQSEIV